MKTYLACLLRRGVLTALLTALLNATPTRAAVISYAGAQTDLGPGWRTPGVSKPLDIDGDNIIGTDGYDVVNLPPAQPNYVNTMTILTSTYPGNGSYAQMDDPTSPGNTFTTGTLNPAVGTGASADLFQFSLTGNATNRTIRVGLLVDNLDGANWNATSFYLVQTSGAGVTNGPVATTNSVFNDQIPDWLFFQISGAAAGDTFIVRGVAGINGDATLGGVAFDSIANVITNAADSGAGSLRTVLAAMSAGSTVTFAPNLSGATITLTNGVILLTNSITIDASALPGGITVSGNNASGIFSVGAGATVSLASLTLANGNQYDGGALYTAPGSTTTVSRCTLTGNFSVEGGAIVNDGPLVLNECTLANNFSSYGGAIQCRAPLTVSQCTISGNDGYYGGGGLYINNAPASVNNSIVAGNTAQAGTGHDMDIFIVYGALVYSNANLVQFVDGYQITTPTSGPVPLTNAPNLAPLGNYGGPTQTMPPLPGSPAIDGCTNGTSFATDQRGFPRIVGPLADLGAVEFQDASPVVTTTADSGVGSLRYATTYTTNSQVITFAGGLSGSNILLTSGQIVLLQSLTIDASALPGGIQINGNNNSRIFQINNSNTVVLNSLTVTNGNGVGAILSGFGGGILSFGNSITLTLNNCILAGNHAATFGGSLYAAFGSMFLNGTTISGGTAAAGAGMGVQDELLTLTGCTVSGNSGGALSMIASAHTVAATFINSTFSGNSASTFAGSVLTLGAQSGHTNSVVLTNCTLSGNTISSSSGQSGAIYVPNGTGTYPVSLYNTIVSGNNSGGVPADIYTTNTVSGTYNLIGFIGVGRGLTNGVNGNKVGINNPQLAALGNYGGLTQTMPPLPGSPAIDAAGATSLTTDQRGFPRPLGLAPDIGAVEGVYNPAGPGILTGMNRAPSGPASFSFTNSTDMSFTVLATTNVAWPLNLWSNLGPVVESPAGSGHYYFTDPQATNYPQRFYRVTSP
jgi:hypothetical protein